MNLRDYIWYGNPRGLVNASVMEPFVLDRFTRPAMGWAKLIVGGTEMANTCLQLVANECMPIIRIGGSEINATHPLIPDAWYRVYREYVAAGAYYFELYETPNLPGIWPSSAAGWESRDVIPPLMDTWLNWAERIIGLGGYPAFPSLGESTERASATVYWFNAMLLYLKVTYPERMQAVIANGLWCATSAQAHNRFYQEPPGGPAYAARPYYQVSADEPGWHFEYPYDALQQKLDPGRTVFGQTSQVPMGAPGGLIASGQAFQELLKRHFDAGPVPVIGTSGGIWPVPHHGEEILSDDRYPPYSYESHAEATLAMFEWIARQGPPWFWGVTLTSEAEYYETQGMTLTIERLIETEPIYKIVPEIATGGGGSVRVHLLPAPVTEVDGDDSYEEITRDRSAIADDFMPLDLAEDEAIFEVDEIIGIDPAPPFEPIDEVIDEIEVEVSEPEAVYDEIVGEEIVSVVGPPIGPKPVEGIPDHHWLVLAGIDSDWFFDSAHRYWQTFRPTILAAETLFGSGGLISYLPPTMSLAVTVLAPADVLSKITERINMEWPGVLLDPVPFDTLESLQAEMNRRAIQEKRFG